MVLVIDFDDVAIGLVLCVRSSAVFLLPPSPLAAADGTDFDFELAGCGLRGFETTDLPG